MTCALGRRFLAATVFEISANDKCAAVQILISRAHGLERCAGVLQSSSPKSCSGRRFQGGRELNSVRVCVCVCPDSGGTTDAYNGRCVRPSVVAVMAGDSRNTWCEVNSVCHI